MRLHQPDKNSVVNDGSPRDFFSLQTSTYLKTATFIGIDVHFDISMVVPLVHPLHPNLLDDFFYEIYEHRKIRAFYVCLCRIF
mmetsp:Transcript_18566/g.17879  ORF Transcript_18566/g.17879 Transcript_18566/m.17879 type:complete len:83 (+) Transcript_18566:552-800(+)